MTAHETTSDDPVGPAPRMRQISCLTTAVAVGFGVSCVVMLAVAVYRNKDSLPPLTVARFEEAKQRWAEAGIDNYDIEVTVTGRQPARYYVEVRDGEIGYATRNGDPLRQRRTMGTWSVPGMWITIQSDVDNVELHRSGKADHGVPQLLLRGSFHSERGYPLRYHRTELRKFGSNVDVMWNVTHFEIVE